MFFYLREIKMKFYIAVVLVVAFFGTTYASKCIGECESWIDDDMHDDYGLDHLLEHEDCDKYCECTPWGELIEYSCEDGKYFSYLWGKCVHPSLTECKNVSLDTTLTPILPSSTSPSTIEPPTTSSPTTEPSTTTPPIDENGCIGTCPSKNLLDHVELLPNKNCTKFCMCDWGAAKPTNCPAGLLFNNKVKSCDWPYNVDCQSPNRIEEFKYLASQRTLSKTINYDNEITEQVDDKEDQEVEGCLGNCPMTNSLNYTLHIPHKNCKKFCKCNWGEKIVINCPANLHFNNASKVCDFFFNANCTGVGSIEH